MPRQTALSIAMIVAALAILVWLSLTGADPVSYNQGFYSDDGGATFFLYANSTKAPFDHDGKQADHAYVFTCDRNKTRFVGYLDRYTAAMKTKLDHAPSNTAALMALMEDAAANGIEVAAPHTDQWFPRDSAEGQKILESVRCPHGSQNNLTLAWP